MRLARVFPGVFAGLFLTAAAVAVAPPAAAQAHETPEPGAADARALEDARWQFTEGSAHFERQRYAEALASFERSQGYVASPNTGLMIARCLRELGRGSEAVTAFDRAEAEARKRAGQGETKYAATAEAAKTEGAQLRASLGTITVRVARPAGATVTVDGKPLAISASGEATLLHEPGTVAVIVRDANGGQQKQTVTVAKGAAVTMDFAGDAGTTVPGPVVGPPPPSGTRGSSWAVPAAITAGAVTVAGLAVFTGFGLSSQSTYDDLVARCGASPCGPAERADADSGARAQTIANVGLTVGLVAAAATIVFVVVAISSSGNGPNARLAPPAWLGRIDPGGRPGL